MYEPMPNSIDLFYHIRTEWSGIVVPSEMVWFQWYVLIRVWTDKRTTLFQAVYIKIIKKIKNDGPQSISTLKKHIRALLASKAATLPFGRCSDTTSLLIRLYNATPVLPLRRFTAAML